METFIDSKVAFSILLIIESLLIHYCKCQPTSTRFLQQSDFTDGTVRILENNQRLVFSEDIVFNPNSNWVNSPNEEGAYFPTDASLYPGSDGTAGSFRLGFFAGLSIEANNIELDLNGHTFSVDHEFLMQQRFFTLVGVGKGPFIDGEGPSEFGADIEVSDIHIHNGILGLTAHHGIHGNFVNNIEINDIIFRDFELAGIGLNGFNGVHIHDVEIGPSFKEIPVLGTYTQARGGLLSYRPLRERLSALSNQELEDNYSIQFVDRDESMTVIEIIDRLIDGMDLIFDLYNNGNVPASGTDEFSLLIEAIDVFSNLEGLPDGGAQYGIILNSAGVAVEWFGTQRTDYSTNAVIEDVYIHDLSGKPSEIAAFIRNSDGEHVTGPVKDALPFEKLLNLDAFNGETFNLATDSVDNYHGTLLSDAQIALAMFGNDDELQGNTINDEVIQWALGSSPLTDGYLVCNSDLQFHHIKGLVALRVDRTENVELDDITINNVYNMGEIGLDFCHPVNDLDTYFTHPTTPDEGTDNFKFQGRVARGIALTDVIGDVTLNDIVIDNIDSAHGSSIAIDLIGNINAAAQVILSEDIFIDDIASCSELSNFEAQFYTTDEAFPNNGVFSCSLHSFNSQAGYFVGNNIALSITDVDGPDVCGVDDDGDIVTDNDGGGNNDGGNNNGGGGGGGNNNGGGGGNNGGNNNGGGGGGGGRGGRAGAGGF